MATTEDTVSSGSKMESRKWLLPIGSQDQYSYILRNKRKALTSEKCEWQKPASDLYDLNWCDAKEN